MKIKKNDFVRVLINDVGGLNPNGKVFLKRDDVIKVYEIKIDRIYYIVKGLRYCDCIPIKNVEKINIFKFKKSKFLFRSKQFF